MISLRSSLLSDMGYSEAVAVCKARENETGGGMNKVG